MGARRPFGIFRISWSLRALFVLVFVCALVATWAANVVRDAERERSALKEIGTVARDVTWTPRVPRWWLRFGLALKCFDRVTSLKLIGDSRDALKVAKNLPLLCNLEHLSIVDTTDIRPRSGSEHVGERSEFVEAATSALAQMPSLRSISVSCRCMDRDMLLRVYAVTTLSGLRVATGRSNGCSVRGLSRLPSLERLELSGFSLTEQDAVEISTLSLLRELDLARSGVDNAQVRHFSSLGALRELYLTECRLTDDGVKSIARLPALERLSLAGCPITDNAISAITGSDLRLTLQLLALDSTRVGDRGVKILGACVKLQHLTLQDTRVTAACLPFLAAIPSLATREVDLRNTYAECDGTSCYQAYYEGASAEELREMYTATKAERDAFFRDLGDGPSAPYPDAEM